VKGKSNSSNPPIFQKEKKDKSKKSLQIVSKVIHFNFQDAKIVDLTIDLRR